MYLTLAIIACVGVAFYLVRLGPDSVSVSIVTAVLGLALVIIGTAISLFVYGIEQTVMHLQLKEHGVWARFIPIVYGLLVGSMLSLIFVTIRGPNP